MRYFDTSPWYGRGLSERRVGSFLLHQPLGGVRGQASDITIEAEEIIKMRARLIREIAVETGQPYEKVVTDTERNFWMGAEEAQKYGLVNKIITNASEV